MKNKEQINIRNIHCAYFEGQTGLCQVKEFVKCNPINCKLYTMDELSTIVEFQQKLLAKERECEKLKQWKEDAENLFKTQTDNANKIINRYKQVLDEIEKFANKACESCKKFFPNFQSDINCTCCQPSLILGIINQAKGQ